MANRALLALAFLSGALLDCGGKGLSGTDAGTTGAAGTGGDASTSADADAFTPPDTCDLPFDPGPCEAAIRVYASVNGQCVEKVYGGCQGNENRFFSLEECLMTCEGRPGARECPPGRAVKETCLQCVIAGGCGASRLACAIPCTKEEDCAAAGNGYACNLGVCGFKCF
jgi:hypothetical protein